jgi:uncharacterized protein (TIGR03083 family)
MMDLRGRRAADAARTERSRARDLLRAEVDTWSSLLATLSDDEWLAPTVCDRWRVRDIVGHLTGHAEEVVRPWQFPLRNRRGHRSYPELAPLDAHMEVQVDEHRDLPVTQLAADYATTWARALRALRRMPELVRRRSVATGIDAMPRLTLGELGDIIYLRDNWMHRDDVCRAVGRPTATQPHDEEVVTQVLRDLDRDFWSGPSVVVELTGHVEGAWTIGDGDTAATVQVDALHFMRVLAGRAEPTDVTCVSGDADIARALADTRVPF